MSEHPAKVAKRAHKRRVRALTPSGERQPCFVCEKFRPVTERHHVAPVAGQPVGSVDVRTAWLCPTCHAILHRVLEGAAVEGEFAAMLSAAEWNRINSLVADAREDRRSWLSYIIRDVDGARRVLRSRLDDASVDFLLASLRQRLEAGASAVDLQLHLDQLNDRLRSEGKRPIQLNFGDVIGGGDLA